MATNFIYSEIITGKDSNNGKTLIEEPSYRNAAWQQWQCNIEGVAAGLVLQDTTRVLNLELTALVIFSINNGFM